MDACGHAAGAFSDAYSSSRRLLVALVCERLEEGNQRIDPLLVKRRAVLEFFKTEGRRHLRFAPWLAGLGIDLGAVGTGIILVVETHHGLQILEDAVMHIRPGHRDIAQGYRLVTAIGGHIVCRIRVLHQAMIDEIGERAIAPLRRSLFTGTPMLK